MSTRTAFREAMAAGDFILTGTSLAGTDGKTLIYTIRIPYHTKGRRAGVITTSIKFVFINNISEG